MAEMTSAFLCGHCGILLCTEKSQAAYLQGWLKRLKSDPTMLVKAKSAATAPRPRFLAWLFFMVRSCP